MSYHWCILSNLCLHQFAVAFGYGIAILNELSHPHHIKSVMLGGIFSAAH